MGINEIPTFITPTELADLTGELVSSITRGIREGRIPADKVNGRWRISTELVFPNARREAERRLIESQRGRGDDGCGACRLVRR